MCPRSPEGEPYPGLHPQQRGQQVEGGDSAPLLCSVETPPGVLHPALRHSAQERHGSAGALPEEGHKNGQKDGTPVLREQAETAGVVRPGEEKAPERPYCSLSELCKGAYTKDGDKHFSRACCNRTRDNGFKLKEGRFRLDIRQKFSAMRVVKLWNKLPREVVEDPSLGTFSVRLDGALSSLI